MHVINLLFKLPSYQINYTLILFLFIQVKNHTSVKFAISLLELRKL